MQRIGDKEVNIRELDGQQKSFYPSHPARENGAGQSRPHVSVERGADKAMSAENPTEGKGKKQGKQESGWSLKPPGNKSSPTLTCFFRSCGRLNAF